MSAREELETREERRIELSKANDKKKKMSKMKSTKIGTLVIQVKGGKKDENGIRPDRGVGRSGESLNAR